MAIKVILYSYFYFSDIPQVELVNTTEGLSIVSEAHFCLFWLWLFLS